MSEELGEYPVLSKEALIRYNPDFIILMVKEGKFEGRYEKVKREWKKLSTMKAVREKDFRFIIGKDMVIPGPRAVHFLPLFEKLIWETEPGGYVEAKMLSSK